MHNDLTHYHQQTLVDGGHGPADVSPLDGDQEVLGPGLVAQVLDHYTTWNHFKLIEKEIRRAKKKTTPWQLKKVISQTHVLTRNSN